MESTAPKEKATGEKRPALVFFPLSPFPLELWIPYKIKEQGYTNSLTIIEVIYLIRRRGVASYVYMNGQLATLVASAQMQSFSCVAKQGHKCSVYSYLHSSVSHHSL